MILVIGSKVFWKDRPMVLSEYKTPEIAILIALDGSGMCVAPVSGLRTTDEYVGEPRHLLSAKLVDIEEAYEAFSLLKPLLSHPRPLPKEAMADAADRLGVCKATVYRLIKQLRADPTATSLLRKTRSDRGETKLDPLVEEVIDEHLQTHFLIATPKSIPHIGGLARGVCKARGLDEPSNRSIHRRAKKLRPRDVLAKQKGQKAARNRYEPIRGSFPGAGLPLQTYQIDHTRADVILVDRHRRPMGRPWLTIVIDVCTRMIAGFHVSLNAPSELTAGIALGNAILKKDAWLKKLDLDTEWPIYGVPDKIHTDNAKEFRSKHLSWVCKEYGIAVEHRPKGLANFGGHVERVFRTFMRVTHTLPGTTFSNTLQRAEYDSARRAKLTLDEYERWFAAFVLKVYHRRPHRGFVKTIGQPMAPIDRFNQLVVGDENTLGTGRPAPVPDEDRLRIQFLPHFGRKVNREGIPLDNIFYSVDGVLEPFIAIPNERDPDGDYWFARDPRDISEIYFLHPDTHRYFPIGYKDPTRPPISLWELQATIRFLPTNQEKNEQSIFDGFALMQKITDDADRTTGLAKAKRQERDLTNRTEAIPAKRLAQAAAKLGKTKPYQPTTDAYPIEDY